MIHLSPLLKGSIASGLILLSQLLQAQPIHHEPLQERFHEIHEQTLFYEAVNLSSDTPPLSRIDVVYRIDMSFFVAVRDPRSPLQEEFLRNGEIVIELIDSLGLSQARERELITNVVRGNQGKSTNREWHQGTMSFDVKPGIYTIAMNVEDFESERRITERQRTVKARDFSFTHPIYSTPFLIFQSDTSTNVRAIFLQNWGGGLKFGEKADALIAITNSPQPDSLRIEYSITHVVNDKKSTPTYSDTLDKFNILNGFRLSRNEDSKALSYELDPSNEGDAVAIIPLDAERLHLGSYLLKVVIRHGTLEQTVSSRFWMAWPDMPSSLRDVSYAIDALRYITSDEEFDSLDRGDDEMRRETLKAFWAAKDQTPGTAYNEVMTEYYSRVDHAAERFGTLQEPDGSKTDRGRIYILYGPPSAADRKLDPKGYVEIWSYVNIGRKFIFRDESRTGTYVLSSSEPL